jgi:hypothetical protein
MARGEDKVLLIGWTEHAIKHLQKYVEMYASEAGGSMNAVGFSDHRHYLPLIRPRSELVDAAAKLIEAIDAEQPTVHFSPPPLSLPPISPPPQTTAATNCRGGGTTIECSNMYI